MITWKNKTLRTFTGEKVRFKQTEQHLRDDGAADFTLFVHGDVFDEMNTEAVEAILATAKKTFIGTVVDVHLGA